MRTVCLFSLMWGFLVACANQAVPPPSQPVFVTATPTDAAAVIAQPTRMQIATANVPPTQIPTYTPLPTDTPTITPTPRPTNTPTPTNTPLPTDTPIPAPERIRFPRGATGVQLRGSVPAEGVKRYILHVSGGQTLRVNLSRFSSPPLWIAIYGADRRLLLSDAPAPLSWEGVVPVTQDYFIEVKTQATVAVSFDLQIEIPPLTPPTPVIQPERIQFVPGTTGASLTGRLAPQGLKRYVLWVSEGQTMRVSLPVSPGVRLKLVIFGSDGTVLISGMANATYWEGVIPRSQDYFIDLVSAEQTPQDYRLEVEIPPLSGSAAPSTSGDQTALSVAGDVISPPEAIRFEPGAVSAQRLGTVGGQGTRRYVVRIGAGQLTNIDLQGDPRLRLAFSGADGTVLLAQEGAATFWQGRVPSTQDYFIDVKSTASTALDFTLWVEALP